MSNQPQAIRIVKRLRKEGFNALFAGGCVRDHLLGRPAKDYDVATSARPEQIIPLFRKTLKIGAQFGVVMVILEGRQVEVATFRTEGGYRDGRHPTHVEFATAEEDALRRDFTINGMFYDPIEKKVLDYVDGREDLQKRIIRTIGDPHERFSEDYLRLLRAVRFAVQLDFEIETRTWQEIQRHAPEIKNISAERIAIEIEGTLTHPNRSKGIKLFIASGLAGQLWPEFAGEKADFGCRVISALPEKIDFALALSAFWAGFDTEQAVEWAKNLRLSNAVVKEIRFLLDSRGALLDPDMPLAKLKMLLAEPYFNDLFELQKAIQLASGQTDQDLLKLYRRAAQLAGREIRPKPLLDGHELIALGVTAGPMVGHAAQELYIAQLSEEIHTKSEAKEWIRNWLEKRKKLFS